MNSFTTIPYKQIQSFGLSTESLTGDFPNINKPYRYDTYNEFNIIRSYAQNYFYQSETISTFGTVAAGDNKYTGFAVTPNGIMYSFGSSVANILRVDTNNDTVTTLFNLGSNRYQSQVLAGNFIYALPTNTGGSILKLNILTETLEVIGTITGNNQYIGMVLANNGNIYGVPFDATRVICIDTKTDSISYFGTITGSANWDGGCLYGDYIYCAPLNSNLILKINTKDNTLSYINSSVTGTTKYIGCNLAANGKIYCIPYDATSILVINPSNDSTYSFGSIVGSTKFVFGVNSVNRNYIYGVTYINSVILRIDTDNDTVTTFGSGSIPGTGNRYRGGALAPNGSIYFAPSRNTSVLKLLSPLPENLNTNFITNRHFNKV